MSEQDRLVKVQSLIVGGLRDLMRSRIAETDRAINAAIARIGSFCDRDRACVFIIKGDRISKSHEWCADGIASHIDDLQDMPLEILGELGAKLWSGEILHVPDMDKLPLGSEVRRILEQQGIMSVVMVPMMEDGDLRGFVSFEAVKRTQAFLEDELYLLQSVADVISTAIARRDRKLREERAVQDLESERAFLRTVMDSSAMGVVVADESGTIQFANEAASALADLPASEIVGNHFSDPRWAHSTEDGTPVTVESSLFRKAVGTGKTTAPEIRRLVTRRSRRFVRAQAAPVPAGENKFARVVLTLSDVTGLIEAQRDMRRAMEDADRANAAKSTFLARMSHELRTPLNGVIGVADLLEQQLTDDDNRRLVAMIRESGAHLLDIINDLLDIAKIEAELVVLRRQRINLAEIAERACSTHRLRAEKNGLKFDLHISGRQRAARVGDDKRISQILHNVIGNAVKFTPEGSISVHLDCTAEERIVIRCTDTGIGMSDEDLITVFDEFVQFDLDAIYQHGGTGLGLPISKRLAEMMDGSISVESELGKGSEFTVELLLHEPSGVPGDTVGETAGESDGAQVDLSGCRVLLADDNPTNRMVMQTMLERLSAEVTAVDDGAQALEAWKRHDYDVIFLDIAMPILDGLETLRAITSSSEGTGRAVPTMIAFTAHGMDHQIESYLGAGFESVFTKPMTIAKLDHCLRDMGYPARPIAEA